MTLLAEHHWNKGKSEHKFTYTYSTIAQLTGLKVGTLRRYASQGKFNPNNLKSVLEFIKESL